MKDSVAYGASLDKLIGRLRSKRSKPFKVEPTEPLEAVLLGCLSMSAAESRARAALSKLRQQFVDCNELRVARVDEIVELLGKTYPQVKEAAGQMLEILNAIFDAQNHMEMNHLKEKGKREAKMFLDDLAGMTPYVSARVMLCSLGAHAFPVHEPMLRMLRGEEVVDEASEVAEVEGFLERHVSASEIHEVYALLRKHADNYRGKKRSGASEGAQEPEKNDSESSTTKKTSTPRRPSKSTKSPKAPKSQKAAQSEDVPAEGDEKVES